MLKLLKNKYTKVPEYQPVEEISVVEEKVYQEDIKIEEPIQKKEEIFIPPPIERLKSFYETDDDNISLLSNDESYYSNMDNFEIDENELHPIDQNISRKYIYVPKTQKYQKRKFINQK